MKKVSISTAKAELSRFIRDVRNGAKIVIFDREKPVAVLSAWDEGQKLNFVKPTKDSSALFKLLANRRYDQESDIVALLLQEREDRF